jgi:cytosine/adenosine deaminase-related metal-dependent hydrolase
MRTVIRGGWVVGSDGTSHTLVRDGIVVIDDDRITSIETEYDGTADEEIDARDCLVSPGLIDTHVHPGTWERDRSIADTGRKVLMGLPFQEHAICAPGQHAPGDYRYEGTADADKIVPDSFGALFTQVELLSNGITTFVDAGTRASFQRLHAQIAEKLGTRAYLAPGYQSTMNEGGENGKIVRDWDYEATRGNQEFADAIEFVKEFNGTQNDRIRGMLYPRETDFCSPEQLRRTREVADELGVPVQTHAAYSAQDFYFCVEQYGLTPIELLADVGLLGPDMMVAHPLWFAESDLTSWQEGQDLELLAKSGTSAILCPITFARRGWSFDVQQFAEAGVNVVIGNDTFPRDIIQNMRLASYNSKILRKSLFASPAEAVFTSPTINAANGLQRPDLGRLTPGAKADVITIRLRPHDSLRWGVVYDPIKALVDVGMGDDVRTVLIDGVVRMRDRVIEDVDIREIIDTAQESAEDFWRNIQNWDPFHRTMEEKAPWSFPVREGALR